MSDSTEAGGTVLHYPFDFSDYRDPDNRSVEADVAAADVTRVLQDLLGGEVVEWPGARGSGEALARLKEFARLTHTCSLVWVGHGASDDDEASVLIPGIAGSSEDDEFTPEAFALHLRNQQSRRHGRADEAWTMVVIEACGAGRFVQLVAAELLRRRSGQRIALVGVGAPDGPGHLGEAAKILGQVVRSTLTRNDTEVVVSDFLAEVERRLGDHDGATYALGVASCRIRRPGIPVTATLDVYAHLEAVLHQLPEDERSHFARKGMGADFGEFTWSFVGRRDERHRVVEHLSTGSGLLAVTGPAGSGKSAVLGNVLLRARPKVRELLVEAGLLDNDPVTEPERDLVVDGVLHVTGMTHDEVARSLANLLGADLSPTDEGEAPPTGDELANRLVAAVEADHQQRRIVVDGLDEARDPLSVARLLRRVTEAGVSLVVGTRASTREGVDHATHDSELLDELGVANHQILIVGRDPDALAEYVNLTCAREGVSDHLRDLLVEVLCSPVTDTTTGRERQFLFVRLLVHELVVRQRLGENPDEAALELLEGTHRTVFAAAVARLREHAPAAASLLEALAYARGVGLPRLGGIWELVASVVRGASVTPVDIDDALSLLAPYVMLDAESGRSVYRLAHRTFAEYFEQEWADEREVRELAVARGLIALANDSLAATGATDRNLDAYLVWHLATHVAAAGTPGWQLLADNEPLLDVIDPRTVASEVMASGILENIPPAIASVAMGAHLLATCDLSDRHGVRQLVGAGVTGQLAAEPSASATWWVRAAARSRRPVHRTFTGHTDWVTGITCFTRHGRLLLATTSRDRTVRIWDPVTGQQVGEPLTGHTKWVSGITCFTRHGRLLLATTSRDRTVRIWDPVTGQQVGEPLTGHTKWVSGITCFTRHGRLLLATTSRDRTVRIWDPVTGQQVGEPLTGHTKWVSGITCFTRHGRLLLATTSNDRTVRIWDPVTGQQVGQSFTGHTSGVTGITCFTRHDRPLLATTSNDATVRIWDPVTGQQVGEPLTGHTRWVSGITSFTHHNGRLLLATTSGDRTVRIWDPDTGGQVGQPLTGHTDSVIGIINFTHHNGRPLLATTSNDATVRIWDPVTGQQVGQPPSGHTKWVSGITSLTHQGRLLLATTSGDRTVRNWDPVTGQQVGQSFTGHTDSVTGITSFTHHHGRTLLATTSWDETVRIWDPVTGQQVGQSFTGHTSGVTGITSFTHHHGRTLLATTSWDRTVRIWDPDTGQQVGQPLTGHTQGVIGTTCFTHHNGRPLLATTSADKPMRTRRFDAQAYSRWARTWGWLARSLISHAGGVAGIFSFPRRGRTLLATISDDRTVRIWDPGTGQQVGQPLTGHTNRVTGIASFTHHDGRALLATTSSDRTVRIWDPGTGQQVGQPLTGHTDSVTGITSFTHHHGRTLLATTSWDETVRIWDPESSSAVGVLGLHHGVYAIASLGDDLVVGLNDGWARIVLPGELG